MDKTGGKQSVNILRENYSIQGKTKNLRDLGGKRVSVIKDKRESKSIKDRFSIAIGKQRGQSAADDISRPQNAVQLSKKQIRKIAESRKVADQQAQGIVRNLVREAKRTPYDSDNNRNLIESLREAYQKLGGDDNARSSLISIITTELEFVIMHDEVENINQKLFIMSFEAGRGDPISNVLTRVVATVNQRVNNEQVSLLIRDAVGDASSNTIGALDKLKEAMKLLGSEDNARLAVQIHGELTKALAIAPSGALKGIGDGFAGMADSLSADHPLQGVLSQVAVEAKELGGKRLSDALDSAIDAIKREKDALSSLSNAEKISPSEYISKLSDKLSALSKSELEAADKYLTRTYKEISEKPDAVSINSAKVLGAVLNAVKAQSTVDPQLANAPKTEEKAEAQTSSNPLPQPVGADHKPGVGGDVQEAPKNPRPILERRRPMQLPRDQKADRSPQGEGKAEVQEAKPAPASGGPATQLPSGMPPRITGDRSVAPRMLPPDARILRREAKIELALQNELRQAIDGTASKLRHHLERATKLLAGEDSAPTIIAKKLVGEIPSTPDDFAAFAKTFKVVASQPGELGMVIEALSEELVAKGREIQANRQSR